MKHEDRIYIIVPQTVQVGKGKRQRNIAMPAGRLMAQCSHVGRKMERLDAIVDASAVMSYKEPSPKKLAPYREVTTIVLGVRNTKELKLMGKLLYNRLGRNGVHSFEDTDRKFYGTKEKVMTAICTLPVDWHSLDDLIGHLELA